MKGLPYFFKKTSAKKDSVSESEQHSHHLNCCHEHPASDKKEYLTLLTGAGLLLAGILFRMQNVSFWIYFCLFLSAYLLLGGKVLLSALKNILHGQIFDENFLMSLAAVAAFLIGEYPEAAGIMLFYQIGEQFEHHAMEKSRTQIKMAVDLRPQVVQKLIGEQYQTIPAKDAVCGDLLLIRPGDRIPLDGVIVRGNSRLDTSPVTGESIPVGVSVGDEIFSGCLNTSGQLILHVTKPLSESMVTRILQAVEQASLHKPKIDRFVTRFARIYTPIVMAITIAVALLPPIFVGQFSKWLHTGLTFLVMSCPCALVISVPLAFFSGIGASGKMGILFKGGSAMETASQIKAIALDKTGTLTKGDFTLQKILPEKTITETRLLSLCASLESHSTHPIACSIVTAAKKQGLSLTAPTDLKEIAGQGICGTIGQDTVLCGNETLMQCHNISVPKNTEDFSGAFVYVAVNEAFAGALLISDTLKEHACETVAELKAMGITPCLLTGDSPSSANDVAKRTGIHRVYARLLPEEKLQTLQTIRTSYGATMFVGDGINDAPVLAGADVGAAMGNGADAALEVADIVFMRSNATAISLSVRIARDTKNIALFNIVFALAVKAIIMLLNLRFSNMWLAIFADTGVAMLCILNSIRILYRKYH